MPADDPRLLAYAERVADRDPIDFPDTPDADLEASVNELRVVAEIASLYHGLASSDSPMASSGAPAPAGPRSATDRDPTPEELIGLRKFGSFYARAKVASGSFGDVYRAWDPNLRREVALKILKGRAVSTDATASILREGQLLAKISHPNVMAVYGADIIDGCVAISSELLRGRTLGDIVTRDGPMGPQEAVVAGDAVCRALAAVHNANLLHRDIKAQNVMREAGGRIVLMDFGLGHEADALRLSGDFAGTPLYLAPELFNGGQASRSSDIYGVGVLLFYLVTGSYPVEARNLTELRTAHRLNQRKLLQEVRPDLPAAFCQAVEQALNPDPAMRFESVGTLQQALARSMGMFDTPPVRPAVPRETTPLARRPAVLAGIALVAVIAAISAWLLQRPQPAAVPQAIAILPLRNTSGDPSKDYFADALTQELMAKLWKLGSVRVIAPTSTIAYRDVREPADLQRIANDLHVGMVVNGSVSWIGDRVRVVATMVDVTTGASVWSETYDRHIEDILDVQSALSQQLAEALGARLTPNERASVRSNQPVDFDTYQLYLKGRFLLSQRTPASVNEAITTFVAATKRSPTYAPAFAALANAYNVKWGLGLSPAALIEMRQFARQAAQRAIELDDTSAEAHLALAFLGWTTLDWDAAGRSFERAVALNPGETTAHHWYAMYLSCVGQLDEAIRHVQIAQQLDPVNVRTNSAVGWIYYQARQYGRAEAQLVASLKIDPRMAAAHNTLAILHSLQEQPDQALAEAQIAVNLAGGDPEFRSTQAYVLARAGRTAEARAILADLTQEGQLVIAGSIAVIYGALGDVDRAFEWLEKSLEARDIWAAHLRVEPRLDPLRGDRRFDDFVRRQTSAAPFAAPPPASERR
jgi:TolB-like protein/Flp pilus assembly protein TadD